MVHVMIRTFIVRALGIIRFIDGYMRGWRQQRFERKEAKRRQKRTERRWRAERNACKTQGEHLFDVVCGLVFIVGWLCVPIGIACHVLALSVLGPIVAMFIADLKQVDDKIADRGVPKRPVTIEDDLDARYPDPLERYRH